MEFLAEYGIFLAKAVTIVIAIIIVIGSIVALGGKNKKSIEGHIEITNISEDLADIKEGMLEEVLSEDEYKTLQKNKKKTEKADKKAKAKKLKADKKIKKSSSDKEIKTEIDSDKNIEMSDADIETESSAKAENSKTEISEETEQESHRVFVINFDGDVEASAVENLREEITAIISIADPKDEVVVCLESPGGMVHSYGLAASQLTRIKAANLKLVIVVDQVAASGGYMMACVGDEILAAPFAILGSIGVVAELPNFHRLLKHNKVDYEQHTAGEFKRTITMFSENTEAGRKKFKQELEETHDLFKSFIAENRPSLDIDKVATGEHWYGTQALDLGLIDGITTSDDYIVKASENNQVFEISYQIKKPFSERFSFSVQSTIEKAFLSVWKKNIESRLFK
ncbi:MAG: protease SohB [Gammaproteobacteria bacterium]|nr:MAG: protease SohB [Gammaproteobacteria bacterium]